MKSILFISLLFLLAACGKPSPYDQRTEALKITRSWTATARMAGEAWQQGAIPDQYAQQTLTKSQQEIGKAQAGLSSPPVLFQQVQQAIQDMTMQVQHHNKAAIATSLQRISAQQQQLDTLAKAAGAQP